MKPLVKSLLLSSCLLFFLNVSSQNKMGDDGTLQGSSTSTISNNESGGSGSGTIVERDLGTPSSIYFNHWTDGTVILKDNTVHNNWPLRYNIQSQQMQFVYEGDTAAFANPEEISSITIEDHKFLYDEFLCENDIKRKGYLELLVDGNCKLYLHRCIAYRYVDACAEPGAENVKEEYYMAKRFLISENGSLPEILPEKKKELISMLDDEDKNIKMYIKDNHIKLCNEDDLKELFSYYNSN